MTQSLADLYLVLSRAVRPPVDPLLFPAMRDALVDDLEDLGAELGFGFDREDLVALRDALAEVPDHLTLLQLYSQIFLVPPLLVPPCIGLYLDATVLGRSVDDVRAMYLRHGVTHAPECGELPDTLGVVLEFLAHLHAKAAAGGEGAALAAEDAEKLVAGYLRPALPMMIGKLERVGVEEICHANPYLPLLRIVAGALWGGVMPQPAAAPAAKNKEPAAARPEDQQNCRVCAQPFMQGVDIRNMKKVLRKKGLDADFLNVCPSCRTTEMGLTEVMPPEIRRRSWGRRENA